MTDNASAGAPAVPNGPKTQYVRGIGDFECEITAELQALMDANRKNLQADIATRKPLCSRSPAPN